MRNALIVLVLSMTPAVYGPVSAIAEPATIANLKSELSTTWHVQVVDHDVSSEIVPLVPSVNGPIEMGDVAPTLEDDCLRSVIAAFSVYPPPFVSALVTRVALADGISIYSTRVGGFQIPGVVALNCDQAETDVKFNADTVHEGLAGILLSKYNPDFAPWRALNAPGFTYGDMNNVKAELRDPQGRFGDDELYRNGFVSRLGLTDVTNDFDTFAGQVFGHPQETVVLLAKYPALRPKVALLIKIYRDAAPGLARFFDRSGLTAAAG